MKQFLCALIYLIAFGVAHADTRNLTWYNEDGTTYATTVCTVGEDVILPTSPTKTGYTFKGWTGYQVLEYIESTGEQWINTGIASSSRIGIQTEYVKTSNNGQLEVLFGATDKADANIATGIFRLFGPINNYNRVAWGGTQKDTVKTIYGYDNLGTVYTLFFEKNRIFINGSRVYESPYNNEWSFPETIFIFARNTNGVADYPVIARIYYFKIFSDNNIVRDFIPVRRTADGAVGMYDSVTRQFFGNSGAGEFIAGPIVGAI